MKLNRMMKDGVAHSMVERNFPKSKLDDLYELIVQTFVEENNAIIPKGIEKFADYIHRSNYFSMYSKNNGQDCFEVKGGFAFPVNSSNYLNDESRAIYPKTSALYDEYVKYKVARKDAMCTINKLLDAVNTSAQLLKILPEASDFIQIDAPSTALIPLELVRNVQFLIKK